MNQKDDEDATPTWRTPREPCASDFGSFATLMNGLARERGVRDIGAELGSEGKLFDAIRDNVERMDWQEDWVQASEAKAYLRDIVYGGVDGLAYIRSLAQFVGRPLDVVSSNFASIFKLIFECLSIL